MKKVFSTNVAVRSIKTAVENVLRNKKVKNIKNPVNIEYLKFILFTKSFLQITKNEMIKGISAATSGIPLNTGNQ